ncbi:MAG: hypothetical protein U0X75_02705 [Acidobacteriota bacterium]
MKGTLCCDFVRWRSFWLVFRLVAIIAIKLKSREPISWNEEGVTVMVLLRVFGLVGWLAIIVYLSNPTWMRWSELPLPEFARWIGVVTGVISVASAALLVVQKYRQEHHANRQDQKRTSAGDQRPIPLGETSALQRGNFAVSFLCADGCQLVYRLGGAYGIGDADDTAAKRRTESWIARFWR